MGSGKGYLSEERTVSSVFEKGELVIIQNGWDGEGRVAEVLGTEVKGRDNDWTPVLFADEDDPTFFKTDGLRRYIRTVINDLPEQVDEGP